MSDSTKSYLDLIAQRAAEAKARLITQENKSHLMPMRHPQPDFSLLIYSMLQALVLTKQAWNTRCLL